jgi:hypothetical protein
LAYPSSMDLLAGLPEDVRKLALDRFRIIQPHLARPSQLEAFGSHKWLKINEGGKKVSPTKQSG